MKKILIALLITILLQFLQGCIAFLPPYHKTSTETILIVVPPDPIIVDPPLITRPPVESPHVKPIRPIKERPKQMIDNPTRDGDSGRVQSESLRNSGERKRK